MGPALINCTCSIYSVLLQIKAHKGGRLYLESSTFARRCEGMKMQEFITQLPHRKNESNNCCCCCCSACSRDDIFSASFTTHPTYITTAYAGRFSFKLSRSFVLCWRMISLFHWLCYCSKCRKLSTIGYGWGHPIGWLEPTADVEAAYSDA